MDTPSDLLVLVISLVWACLQVPGSQNDLFQLFSNMDIVADLACAASLTFCPGLIEVLDAAAPPTVAWFKQLPSDCRGKWGVYVLVMEKMKCKARLYCGSATDSDGGIVTRWALYDRHNLKLGEKTHGLPSGVLKAFQDGFKITHKGLLVTAPMASPANAPMYRLLFYALEATFSFYLWMMNSGKFFLYHKLCPWTLSEIEYDGLCSHSALFDPIAGCFDLTPEELMSLAAELEEKKRQHNQAYQRAYYQYEREHRSEELKERHRRHDLSYRMNSRDKSIAKQRRYEAKHKAAKTFWCEICEKACSKPYEWDRHLRSTNHRNRQAKADASIELPYRCEICLHSCAKPSQLESHCQGQRHKERVAALQAAASSST
jgi:hypothetical protein